MGLQIANNASTTLASDITDSVTALTVASGTGSEFPSLSTGDYYYCTIVAPNGAIEIVKVTDRTTDVFTIIRAQDGTVASAFSTGATVENRMNVATFTDILTASAAADALPTPVVTEFLGAYASGTGEWESKTATELRTQLGSTTVGDGLFIAASAAAAQQAMDTEVGVDVQAYDVDTLKADVFDVRTESHPSTMSSVTANTLAMDLESAEVFDWTPTGAATLSAPTVSGAGVWYIRYNYSAAPTLPKATFDDSTYAATGDLLLIIGYGAADYELAWINGA